MEPITSGTMILDAMLEADTRENWELVLGSSSSPVQGRILNQGCLFVAGRVSRIGTTLRLRGCQLARRHHSDWGIELAKKIDAAEWPLQLWYKEFLDLIRLLRQARSANLLPNSFARVTSRILRTLVPLAYDTVRIDITVNACDASRPNPNHAIYEDGLMHLGSGFPLWMADPGSEEKIKVGDIGYSQEGKLCGWITCRSGRYAANPTVTTQPIRYTFP
ncbi:hypothetical protein C8R44DRAFT_753353 [Mycena epipterygia]|nr:hypothetical protein C8R44DRAFT_753353 [Mycena epipterygia]